MREQIEDEGDFISQLWERKEILGNLFPFFIIRISSPGTKLLAEKDE